MNPASLSDRQQREIAFYQQYAPRQRVEAVDFAPVEGRESRPWNPYWYVHELVRQRYVSGEQRLLDFGCGIGIAALRFAHLGYQVDGFDLSADNLAIADELAHKHELAERCRFQTMPAEELTYPDNTFDVIVGIDILHHIDIPRAVCQAYRVLKPGGIAIFKEHVEAPLLDGVRKAWPLSAIAPRDVSLDHHITEDERKLNEDDLRIIGLQFDHLEARRFTLLARLDRLGGGHTLRRRLQQLDHQLMNVCPPLAKLGGTVVLIGGKRQHDALAA